MRAALLLCLALCVGCREDQAQRTTITLLTQRNAQLQTQLGSARDVVSGLQVSVCVLGCSLAVMLLAYAQKGGKQ